MVGLATCSGCHGHSCHHWLDEAVSRGRQRMFGKEPKGGEFNPNDPLIRMFGVSPGSR